MKNIIKITSLLVGLLLTYSMSVQAQPFQEGDLVINGGIGVGTTYSWGAGSLGLPIGGGVEYGITDVEVGSIGVGGDFGFVSGNGLTITYIGGKGSYHFNELFELENEDVDLYGGLGIYYRSFSWDNNFGSSADGMVAGFHLGGRYYFADNLGGYAELGNNWAWLNFGVVYKL